MWSTAVLLPPPRTLVLKVGFCLSAEAAFPPAHICLRLNDKSFFLYPHSLACWAVSGDPGVASPGSYVHAKVVQVLHTFTATSISPLFRRETLSFLKKIPLFPFLQGKLCVFKDWQFLSQCCLLPVTLMNKSPRSTSSVS